jgi:hypothetical protein
MKYHPLKSRLYLVVLVLLSSFACSSGVSKKVRPRPVDCDTFTIPPGGTWNASWFDTGIDLFEGQAVTFSATGSVRPSSGRDVSAGPDGTKEVQSWQDSYSFRSDWGHEAVIARIGGGDYIYVGSGLETTAKTGGRLELGVNDMDPGNNVGSFEVEICR